MIEIENSTGFEPDTHLIETMAADMSERDVELLICGDDEIRDLNRQYRGIDKPTDVLSFPLDPSPMTPLGSIVISADFVRRGAETYGHAPDDEFALLFVHGLLHLLGFDHETDSGEMRSEEARILHEYGLPDSLIVRTEKEN